MKPVLSLYRKQRKTSQERNLHINLPSKHKPINPEHNINKPHPEKKEYTP